MLCEKHPDKFEEVVSLTTRGMRENEINGVDYHFVSKEEFVKEI